MIVDSGVEGVVVTRGFTVAERVDAVTKEADDVFESFWIGIEVENVVRIRIVVPTLGKEIFEDGRAI